MSGISGLITNILTALSNNRIYGTGINSVVRNRGDGDDDEFSPRTLERYGFKDDSEKNSGGKRTKKSRRETKRRIKKSRGIK